MRRALPLLFVVLLSGVDAGTTAARAADAADAPDWWDRLLAQGDRRRPGGEQLEYKDSPPTVNPGAVSPPSPSLDYEKVPVPDRWRIIDALGVRDNPLNPYQQSTIKGDRPIFGDDWFINFGVTSDTVYELRSVPVPVGGATTANSGSNSTFGRAGQSGFVQSIIPSISLIHGNTAFKPPEIELRFTPVLNYNYTTVKEVGILNADPRKGKYRSDQFVGFQDAFLDYHLGNISERYDFASLRVGIQPFSSDFRGFLFQDNQLGTRLFGNIANNRFQYNLAYFRRIEKDTNSGLNDLGKPLRKDDIYVANLYTQDFPVKGFTTQGTVIHNRNNENDFHYDENGFLVRPASLGLERPHNYEVTYLGLNGDGHFGRFNLTTSVYYALGTDSANTFTGKKADIEALFAAAEPSIDFDYVRLRLSGLFASADRNPYDNTENGFDAIFENPQFAGADTSYWIRQGIPLIGGGGVALSGRNGVLPSLRSSKDEGQSNFINPGLTLFGVGADVDILPELRFSANFNRLDFVDTSVLKVLRAQNKIDKFIGYDLSGALTYRPFLTQNVLLRLSGAVLLPGQGFKDLYDTIPHDQLLYSVLGNVVLTY